MFTKIIEKPAKDKVPSNYVKLVVDLFKNPEKFFEILEKIADKDNKADDIYEQGINELLKEQTARVVIYEGAWKILKYPWHVLNVMEYFLSLASSFYENNY